MNKVNWEAEISNIIEQNSTCLYQICKLFVGLLEKNSDTAKEGFQYFLTEVSPPRYTEEDIPDDLFEIDETEIDSETQIRISKMEFQLVKELILKDVSVDDFYEEIWKRVSDTLLVSDIYQKSFFLYQMWLDPRIPYFQLGVGVDMDDETYKNYVHRLQFAFKKVLFVMNAGYPKRTQKVSVLLKIADDITDPNERIVFWSLTIGLLENRITKLKKHIEELESIIESDDMNMNIE